MSFQPGSQDYGQQNGNGKPSGGSGVQEAIKILSLRLPRVVGAQGVSPMPLLTSQGSGGNPRVDSIVNQVLSRLPQGPPMARPMSPQQTSGPNFSGAAMPSYQSPASQQAPWQPPSGFAPRVTVGLPPPGTLPEAPFRGPFPFSGTDADLSGAGQPPGMIAPLPDMPFPQPPMPNFDQPIFRRPQPAPEYPSGGDPFDTPLI